MAGHSHTTSTSDKLSFVAPCNPLFSDVVPAADHSELDQFLSRYRDSGRHARDRAPDLHDSLSVFAALPGVDEALRALPARCRVLIEGYAGPGNAAALRRFLSSAGVREADITAVDLFDLPATYARLGLPLPAMRFVQADACRLGAVAANNEFDVVAQDFLLNCLPPLHTDSLLAEAARVLSLAGRFILSFTDSSCLASRPILSPARLKAAWGVRWDPTATQLAQLAPDPAHRDKLLRVLAGSVVLDPETGGYALITAPYGRFEFFVPAELTRCQLIDAGFRVLLSDQRRGRDDHGLDCQRHRWITCHR